MMPSYHSGIDENEDFLSFATLPLPEAAVVIDVRQRTSYDVPLLDYLAIEVEDLTQDMRLHQVPRWRHLAECIHFLQLDVRSLFAGLFENSDFSLTTHTGKQTLIQTREELMTVLGHEHLDQVRNHHIHAIKDSAADLDALDVSGIDPEQPTVRVFFLADMEQPESVNRAGVYARWLKAWIEEQHGPQRFTRDLRMHTVLVCLNVGATFPHDLLASAVTQEGKQGLDTVILLQKYRDDAAYVGGDGQLYYAELVLYTLLLHWPSLFKGIIDDPHEARFTQSSKEEDHHTLPCPTYTIGISALEASTRWAVRWIDYGVTARLLATLSDPHSIDANESQQITMNIHKWMQNWWQELQASVPQDMLTAVDELQVESTLQRACTGRSFVQSTPKDSEEALLAWANSLAAHYSGTGTGTLEHAMNHSAASIVQQLRWENAQLAQYKDGQEQPDETYSRLLRLYGRIKQLLLLHFQDAQAKAALPRALQQLATVVKEAQALKAIERNAPNLGKLRQDFLAQVESKRASLQEQTRTWPLPLIGHILRSTVLSCMFVLLLGMVILLAINWQSVVTQITAPGAALHAFAQQPFFVLIGMYVLVIALLGCGEAIYLSWRNQRLATMRASIRDQLAQFVRSQLDQVNQVIAARVALTLLEWADLATTYDESSPYRQRLTQINGQLLKAQQKAAEQQNTVHKRIKQFSGKQVAGISEENDWPDLNSRTELLNWDNVEDAFLQTCEELTTHPVALNMLAEMLLRRLGTEKPSDILQDIVHKQLQALQAAHPEQTQLSVEEQFRITYLMVVTMLLSFDVTQHTVSDVLPVLQQYSTLKERVLLPTTTTGVDVTKIQRTLKEATLAGIMQQSGNVAVVLKQKAAPEEVLVSWVGSQHETNAFLTRTLAASNVLACLEERMKTIPQALLALQKQSVLLGYPDELDGEDYVYFLLGPGEGSDMFLKSYDPKIVASVRPMLFPDREKLVYLHIHRIRQLSTGLALKTKHAS